MKDGQLASVFSLVLAYNRLADGFTKPLSQIFQEQLGFIGLNRLIVSNELDVHSDTPVDELAARIVNVAS